MAFSKHPHQLELKRSNSQLGVSYNDLPMFIDERGRRRYNWDAFYVTLSQDPIQSRKRDVWELAEYLDKVRRAREYAQDTAAIKRAAKLAKLKPPKKK